MEYLREDYMFFIDFVIALIMAIVLSSVFILGFRRYGPWKGFLPFFLIIFLAAWAGGLWLYPFGPALWGSFWLSFLVVGLIFSILLAAFIPSRRPRTRIEAIQEEQKEATVEKALSGFFWILIFLLSVAILV
jgi:hypothetical protein